MTTGRINQVTIFQAPAAKGDTRSRPRGAPRLAGRSRAERISIETRPTRGANPALRPCCAAPPRPPRALRARSEARKRRLLSRLVCASSSRAGPAIRKSRPPAGRETNLPPRAPPSRRPTRSASATRPPLEHPPPEGERREERPVRPSSLLDITLAHRVAVQAPHPRRPASHKVGEGPPTAGPPLGGPAASDLDLSPAGCTEPVAASKLPCAAPASARRGPLSPIELTRSARAPGLGARPPRGESS